MAMQWPEAAITTGVGNDSKRIDNSEAAAQHGGRSRPRGRDDREVEARRKCLLVAGEDDDGFVRLGPVECRVDLGLHVRAQGVDLAVVQRDRRDGPVEFVSHPAHGR